MWRVFHRIKGTCFSGGEGVTKRENSHLTLGRKEKRKSLYIRGTNKLTRISQLISGFT
jgi:hypothetical protein